jgi:hypothetical protein
MQETTNFLALYRGQTVADARMIAVTAEPEIVDQFVRSLAGERVSDQGGRPRKPRRFEVVKGERE